MRQWPALQLLALALAGCVAAAPSARGARNAACATRRRPTAPSRPRPSGDVELRDRNQPQLRPADPVRRRRGRGDDPARRVERAPKARSIARRARGRWSGRSLVHGAAGPRRPGRPSAPDRALFAERRPDHASTMSTSDLPSLPAARCGRQSHLPLRRAPGRHRRCRRPVSRRPADHRRISCDAAARPIRRKA